jgi:tRNA-intron endonuclease
MESQSEQAVSFPIKASLVGTRVVVYDYKEGSFLYADGRYFGTPLGIKKPRGSFFEKPLELSMYEIVYLIEKGIVILLDKDENEVIIESIKSIAISLEEVFLDKYEIYRDLREKCYVVRPGQKFGTDFVVYLDGPGKDHSSFIVQVFPKNSSITALDIVRAGRLATSVKKRFVVANAQTKSYYVFNWRKP